MLSTLLCNFYYGMVERECLPKPRASGSLLLRLTDDFLFVSLAIGEARQFAEAARLGSAPHGFHPNAAKARTNFDVRVRRLSCQNILTEEPICLSNLFYFNLTFSNIKIYFTV